MMFNTIKKIFLSVFAIIGILGIIISIIEPFYLKQIYNNTIFHIEAKSQSIFKESAFEKMNGDGNIYNVKKGGKIFYIDKNIGNCSDILDKKGKCIIFDNHSASGSINIYANASKFNSIVSPMKEWPIGHIFFDENDENICFKISKIAVRETGDAKENNCTNIQYPDNMLKYFDGFIIEVVSNGNGTIRMDK